MNNNLFPRRSMTLLLLAALLLTGCKNTPSDASAVSEQSVQSEHSAADSAADSENSEAAGSDSAVQSDVPGSDSSSAAEQSAAEPAKKGQPALTGENVTAKAGSSRVPVTVSMTDNPGFSFIGVKLGFDAALHAVTLDSDGTGDFTSGDILGNSLAVCTVSPTKPLLALSAASSADLSADGTLFTCYFDIPADAKSGTVYTLDYSVKDMYNAAEEHIAVAPCSLRITVT